MQFSDKSKLGDQIVNELTYHIITRGYAIVDDFYTSAECDFFASQLVSAIDQYKPQGNQQSHLDQYHLHDLLCNNINIARTLEDPRIQQLFAPFLGENWILYAHTSSSLPPNGGNNYGSRIHVDSPRLIPFYPTNIGVLWALCDFTAENGATKMLPGSHHSPIVPSEELFEKNCAQLTCKKGAAVVFNARAWHRAGINKSANWRHSLTMNVCRPFMKQRMDWVKFIPNSITNQLNQQAKRIIGYDTRLPTNLEEFFVEDEKRLYKGGQE